MMRTIDTATPSPSRPNAKAVESAQGLPTMKDDRMSPPLSSGTPYAVRLLTITSTVGLGAILLGQGLWQPDTKAARLPTTEDMSVNRNSLPFLRDRVSVTTLRSSAVSPPASSPSPTSAARQNQLQPSTELPTVRISHGFGNAGQPPLITALPLPQTLSPTTVEPQAAPAPEQTPQQADRPSAVIASLLEPPTPQVLKAQAADTVEIAPRSPSEQIASERKSSQAVPTQAELLIVRNTTEPSDPAALSMQIASPIQPIAMEPTRLPLEGTDTEPLTIAGNTRFSSKELVEVVQKAIAAQAGWMSINRQPTVNRRFSPAELLQASAVITRFYAAHGYTNVKVYLPADGLNSATPKIQIVETPLEPSNRFLLH